MTNDISNIKPNASYELREAASLLGVSKQTIGNYSRAGYLKFSTRRINKRRCWKGSELIRFWKSVN